MNVMSSTTRLVFTIFVLNFNQFNVEHHGKEGVVMMNLFSLVVLASASLLNAMDTLPKASYDFDASLRDSFSVKDLRELAASASKSEIEFAVDYGMLPTIFSYLRKAETAYVSVMAIEKAVKLCPSRHKAMISAGMVEELVEVMIGRFRASSRALDKLIIDGLKIINLLLQGMSEIDWVHFKDVPYVMEAILFFEPAESPRYTIYEEYRIALEVLASLAQNCPEARTFLRKKGLIINRIFSRANVHAQSAITIFTALARDHYSANMSDLFKTNMPDLVTILEQELRSPGTKSRSNSLSLISILLDGPNFKRTRLFTRQLFPCIVKCLWSFQFDQIKYAFSIVSRLMNESQGRLLYKLDEGAIMRGYLETLYLTNYFENFSTFTSFADILRAIIKLFELGHAKAEKELNAYGTHKGAILIRRLAEMPEEPDAQILAADILSQINN